MQGLYLPPPPVYVVLEIKPRALCMHKASTLPTKLHARAQNHGSLCIPSSTVIPVIVLIDHGNFQMAPCGTVLYPGCQGSCPQSHRRARTQTAREESTAWGRFSLLSQLISHASQRQCFNTEILCNTYFSDLGFQRTTKARLVLEV